jgi:ATP-dependent DNA helicase RecG
VREQRSGNISLHKVGDSLHKDVSSLHNPELLAIAAVARMQKRMNPAEMEQIILQLCRGRWLSRHELSVIVDRNSESLRQRFLNPMVEHSLLRLRYPDKPNRADQAYTAADAAGKE